MMTHVCVEAAARASADYGFHVTVVSDACATRNISYGTDTVLAKNVHNATLATIQSFYGTTVTTEEFLKKSD
jgi:nicotinamidase-related amidase